MDSHEDQWPCSECPEIFGTRISMNKHIHANHKKGGRLIWSESTKEAPNQES